MHRLICDICGREKPDYRIKPPYSYFPSLMGNYCPFCHRDTYDHLVDENGERVHSSPNIPNSKQSQFHLEIEEYKKKWEQALERNREIRKKNEAKIMEDVVNLKRKKR